MLIILCANDKYVDEALACTLCIQRVQQNYSIAILGDNISPHSKQRLTEHNIPTIEFDRQDELGQLWDPHFLKLYIPDYFDDNQVIYLDTDTIPLRSLNPIWDTDLNNHYIAAVENIHKPFINELAITHLGPYSHTHFGYGESFRPFNTGVMVMNLDKWRQNNITQQCIDLNKQICEYVVKKQYINAYKLMSYDEYSLNIAIGNEWHVLDEKWNTFPTSTVKRPCIIHTFH